MISITTGGYSPINFFAPHPCYGTTDEFKLLVKELHKNGIEIILDVVYNHTGKSSYRLIDKEEYYLTSKGHDTNYSGCGNTFNSESASSQKMIVDSLVYWANECQVDGFRFDLGSCLTRGKEGKTHF